jgi:serine/threonine protein kinase
MTGDARIGTLLAGYRIETLIGRGGMSVVYLAHHEGLERKAALKLLAPELAEDEMFRRRFISESRIAAGLDHPNVIPVYEAGEADGLLFIAMRYVRGSDLRSLLAEHGPLDAADVVRVMDQLGAALDAAHAEGLVHRDVKPANVLLAPPTPPARVGHLYLADFGLTKKSLSGSGVTTTGQFVGTIDYVAPEQIRSEPVDGRADIYSLGCLLYECLTGEAPFERDTEVAVMFAHLNDPPPAPSAARPGLPAAIDEVVRTAMAKGPDRRSATAGALAAATTAAVRPMLATRPETIGAPSPEPERPRPRALVGGAVLAALVAIAVVVAVVAKGGGSPKPTPSTTGTESTSATRSEPAESPGPALPDGFQGVARVQAGTGKVTDGFPLALQPMPGPRGVVSRPFHAGEGSLWIEGGGVAHPEVLKVDPATGAIDATLRVGTDFAARLGFAEGSSSLWVLTFGAGIGDELFRIDPGSNDVVAHIPIGGIGAGVAIGGDEGIWVIRSDGVLVEIDSGTNRIARTLPPLPHGSAIAVGGGAVWVTDGIAGAVYRVDVATEEVKSISMPGGADGIAVDANGVWVMDRASGQVIRIDPDTGETGAPIRVGATPSGIAAGGGFVWVTSPGEGAIYRIDEGSGQAQSFAIAGGIGPGWVSVGEGGVWTTVG